MKGRALAVALLAWAALACSTARFSCDAAAPHPPRNFGQVLAADGTPTGVYRGGQPETCAELDYLRSLGVRRIVKLNDRGLAQDEAEKSAAARLGLEVLSWPFDASTIGTPASCPDVREALDALRAGDAPVFVHCTAGKDRTGYLIGLYERLVLRKAAPDVLEELRRYGHRGARAAVFPQISRELRKELPACAAE